VYNCPIISRRYFSSKWRHKQSAHAFMIHSSVHHMAALRLLAGATGASRASHVRAHTLYDHQPLLRSHRGAKHMHGGHAFASSRALDGEYEDDMHVEYPGSDVVPAGTATGVSARLTWDSGLLSNVWLCMVASSVRSLYHPAAFVIKNVHQLQWHTAALCDRPSCC
jgi:hypothetical protein